MNYAWCQEFIGCSKNILILIHLEQQIYPGDTSENLPETLDIGDVSESGTSGECASLKLKKVAGEDTGSGSSSSEAAVVT